MRKPGYVSPETAAERLDVCADTVRSWCRNAVSGRPTKLRDVIQNPLTHYFYVSVDEINRLKKGEE